MICKVCSKIRGKSVVLAAKSDNLWKHQGRKIAKSLGHGVAVGEKYMDYNSTHNQNERLFAAIPTDTIQAQVAESTVRDRKKKWIQFVTLLHLLIRGRPITDYEQMYVLYETLKLKNNPHHHWSDCSGWEMAEAIERVVLKKTKEVMQGATFFSLSCDEVTSVDCQSWISVHGYIVRDWKRIHVLLTLERVVEGGIADNLTAVIVNVARAYGGLTEQKIREGLITFGADGVSTFQGAKTGVTVQLVTKHAPFMVGVHCMAHRTNLAVQTLSEFEVVRHVEDVLAALYSYFSSSPKRTLEFQKLAACLESKGNKILRNVKTRWISMLGPAKRLLEEYKPLVMKMAVDAPKEAAAKKNLSMLLDWQNMLTLPCLMPMLHSVNSLIKFAQSPACYIVDFISAVKICEGDLYRLYVDPAFAFHGEEFNTFRSLADDTSMVIEQDWLFCYNREEDHLVFKIAGVTHMALMRSVAFPGQWEEVNKIDREVILGEVQRQLTSAAKHLIEELEKRFPQQEVMCALGICYPQYWLTDTFEATFPGHIATLKTFYGTSRKLWVPADAETEDAEEWVPPPLDIRNLELQSSFFKITMISNAKAAMSLPMTENPMSRLWRKLSSNALISAKLSEFMKVAEIAHVQVLGSVEDERTFSSLAFLKSKLRNRLTTHLDLVVRMFAQDFYNLNTFPYQAAISDWKSKRVRYGGEE